MTNRPITFDQDYSAGPDGVSDELPMDSELPIQALLYPSADPAESQAPSPQTLPVAMEELLEGEATIDLRVRKRITFRVGQRNNLLGNVYSS